MLGGAMVACASMWAGTAFAGEAKGAVVNKSIRPGEVWLDTAGKPIQAHGGSVIAVGKEFYWYGENKEFTDGKQGIESYGIRFYRSRDLYNWTDLGALIPPDLTDASSPLSPKIFPERPHILYNPRTRKFICWIKIRAKGPQYRTVMTADAITGPYAMVHRELRPAGMAAGDFDLVVDAKTGKAFMVFEHDHNEVVSIQLDDDWTNVTDRFTRHFTGRKPPNVAEGIACFQRRGKVYLTCSQMTGYFPNPSSYAIADHVMGPYGPLQDLYPSDRSLSSFNSQISSIFKHPTKRDLYIALADRWLPQFSGQPQFESGEMSRLVRSGITKATSTPRQPLTPEERAALLPAMAIDNVNTSVSRYVWLPIKFRGTQASIEWRSQWRVEDYD
ncbi:MAG: family 43 glycosylhydrolase [Rhizorhabdus sp.]